MDKAANQLAIQLRKSFEHRVLGPEYPSISRIRNYYHKDILLKIEVEASVKKAKTFTVSGSTIQKPYQDIGDKTAVGNLFERAFPMIKEKESFSFQKQRKSLWRSFCLVNILATLV